MAPTIEFDEFLFFIDRNHLMGKGIGFVDVHLLASAQLTGMPLWTADKWQKSAADQLEHYIAEELGKDCLSSVKKQTELRKIKKEIANLKKRLNELHTRRMELEKLMR